MNGITFIVQTMQQTKPGWFMCLKLDYFCPVSVKHVCLDTVEL